MSNVKFAISTIERENEIFIMVRKHLEFLKTNRIRFTWPKKTVEEEYDVKKYKTYKERLKAEWTKRGGGFTKRLLTFFHRSANLQFTIEVSNYGPLGFYAARSNTVTINLNTHLDVVNTIKHEMIHIMLEPFVQKYHPEHERKEMIVDTLLKILK